MRTERSDRCMKGGYIIITGNTGHPGSFKAPQYESCKISVFVWGEGAILKSMKITLQLFVVVLKTHTKVFDNKGHNR